MGCFRGSLRHPKELLHYLSSLDTLNYMRSTVKGVINLFRLYRMVDVTNIDILKLCKIHMDLICPDKIWSIIILVIILKCYISQQWPGFSVNCKRIRFYTCFLWFYSCAFWRILLVLQDLWKRLSKIKQINKCCY